MDYSNKKIYWAAVAVRIILGVVFIYAAYVKLKDPWELFALAISQYQLLPLKAVEIVARSLPWLELAIGILLVSGRWLRVAATGASLLLLTFFALMIRADLMGHGDQLRVLRRHRRRHLVEDAAARRQPAGGFAGVDRMGVPAPRRKAA